MAHLIRPWTYRYLDAEGRRVPKGTPGARRVKERARKWYGAKIPGMPKGKRVPLASDKRAAQQMLAERVRKAERKAAGLTDPFEEHRARPLTDHAEDFARYLADKGDGEDHVTRTRRRCLAVLEGLGAHGGRGRRGRAHPRPPARAGHRLRTPGAPARRRPGLARHTRPEGRRRGGGRLPVRPPAGPLLT
jgi:hypothetical protein